MFLPLYSNTVGMESHYNKQVVMKWFLIHCIVRNKNEQEQSGRTVNINHYL
jgi:hypothetical protein